MSEKTLKRMHYMVIATVFVLLICFCTLYNIKQAEKKHTQAELVLKSYCDNIQLNLQKTFNYTDELIFSMLTDKNPDLFNTASERIMNQPASIFTGYIEGMKLAYLYPMMPQFEEMAGRDISELNFAYTLARLTGELTVEGPVDHYGQSVFLMISPIFEKNKEGLDVFVGEAVVGIDSAAVTKTFKLEDLVYSGYDYELWSVDPMDGSKKNIARSSKEADLSYSIETKFEMPTVWTLSIMPSDGWYSISLMVMQLLLILFILIALALVLSFYRQQKILEKKLSVIDKRDLETGFIKLDYLLSELEGMKVAKGENLSLFYLVLINYEQIIRLCTPEEKAGILQHITASLLGYMREIHTVARTGEADYIIVLKDNSSVKEIENIKKGLVIELIKKVTLEGKSVFLQAECTECQIAGGALPTIEQIRSIIRKYHSEGAMS